MPIFLYPYSINMKSVAAIVISIAVATCGAQYISQSEPFNLVLVSDNSTISGKYLSPCHEGAAIEGLCLSESPNEHDLFYYNFTDIPGFQSTSGYLTWVLRGGNFKLSESMQLSTNPFSNVAVPLFTAAGSGQPNWV
jgi:hypothetical protein